MIIENSKDFFAQIINCQEVLILYCQDVEALCTCILITRFLENKVYYSVYPVDRDSDLSNIGKLLNGYACVLTLNFGNLLNLGTLLPSDHDSKIFVLDTHLPINQHNVVSSRVFILDTHTRIQVGVNEDLIHQRNYRKNTTTSLLEFLGRRATTSELWIASISLTYQFMLRELTREHYEFEASKLMDKSLLSLNSHGLVLAYEYDLNLYLYRDWNLFDAFVYSPHTACQLRMWQGSGVDDLRRLLVYCGIPLVASQIPMKDAKIDMREDFMREVALLSDRRVNSKFKMVHKIITKVFTLKKDIFSQELSAIDVAIVVRSLLDKPGCSSEAITSLQNPNCGAYELAKLRIRAMSDCVNSQINSRGVHNNGSFLEVHLSQNHSSSIARDNFLVQLAEYLFEAYKTSLPTRETCKLPFLLTSRHEGDEDITSFVILPHKREIHKQKTLIECIKKVAETLNIHLNHKLSEPTVLYVRSHHKERLLQCLVRDQFVS